MNRLQPKTQHAWAFLFKRITISDDRHALYLYFLISVYHDIVPLVREINKNDR